MRIRNSKRGNAFVEASLIYPVILVVTVLLIAAAMYFYNMAAQLSDMNRTVRREAGAESGTVQYGDDWTGGDAFSLQKEKGLLSGQVTASTESRFQNQLLFRMAYDHEEAARAVVIREADLLRKRKAGEDLLGELTQ